MFEPKTLRWAPKAGRTLFGAACTFDGGTFDADSVDLTVSKRIASLREAGCGFICYPIGGVRRYLWKPESGVAPPKAYLPDAQMEGALWKNSVCGLISAWIDPDAEDDRLSALSIECIENELNHANYLGVQCVAIELRRFDSPKLADTINRWAQKNLSKFRIWIILPTSTSELKGRKPSSSQDLAELWTIWRRFQLRALLQIDIAFDVGFRLCADCDEEFLDDFLVSRWRGESFTSFWLEPSLFIAENSNGLTLTAFHKNLISKLADVTEYVVLTASDESPETLRNISARVQVVDKFVNANLFKSPFPEDSYDALQIPLQPLSDNLSSGVYHTFELDAVKYQEYKRAIFAALVDIISRKRKRATVSAGEKKQNGGVLVTAFVLGAGRGPLVDALFANVNALRNREFCDWRVEVWAVEKNNSAVQTLEFFNSTRWNGQIKVLECDMRELGEKFEAGLFAPADLIISELLGSFGDNELSPECLNGVSKILTPETISIPQSYTSYLAPIQSSVLRRNLKLFEKDERQPDILRVGRNQSVNGIIRSSVADRLYVVCMKRVCLLADALPCFEFSHPNPSASNNNEKCKELHFLLSRGNCSVAGFAGFFEAHLYKNVVLSTVPGRHTPRMASWAPAFLPLTKCVDVTSGKSVVIKLRISRNVDAGGVWYTWTSRYASLTDVDENSKEDFDEKIQNEHGESQYMRL